MQPLTGGRDKLSADGSWKIWDVGEGVELCMCATVRYPPCFSFPPKDCNTCTNKNVA
jgi:hypothetical protein